MDVSTIVNIILCVLSFVLAAISVVVVVITLKQNSIMLENSSRAYISIHGDVINCGNLYFYIIIKNFGQSSALITSLKCDVDLNKFSYTKNLRPFSHIKNSTLVPNQSLKCAFDHIKLFNSGISSINFEVSYKSNNKEYQECFCINLDAFSDFSYTRFSTKGKELKAISDALHELNERLL